MPPRWMKEREMRLVTFLAQVPLMSLEGIPTESDHEELAARLERAAGLDSVIAALWKAETMKRSLSHHALLPPFGVRGITARMVQIRPCEVDSLRHRCRRERPLTRDAAFCRDQSLAFRGRRGLLGSGGIAIAAWCGPEPPGSRPYPALLRRERMRIGTGPEVVRALVRAGADVDACGGP